MPDQKTTVTDEMVLAYMNTFDRLRDGSGPAPTLNHFMAWRTSLTRDALTAALAAAPSADLGRDSDIQELCEKVERIRARAEKAEKERDENGALLSLTRDALAGTEHQRDEARAFAALWKATARQAIRGYRWQRDRTLLWRDLAGSRRREMCEAEARAEKAERDAEQARADTADVHDQLLRAEQELCEADRRILDAEQARDKALRTAKEALDSHDETLRDIAEGKYAAEPRPLSPDEITDGMVERARKRGSELAGAVWDASVIEAILAAALTEPPSRPDGAEEIEAILTGEVEVIGPNAAREIADSLASRGVRVVKDGAA